MNLLQVRFENILFLEFVSTSQKWATAWIITKAARNWREKAKLLLAERQHQDFVAMVQNVQTSTMKLVE